MFVFGYRTERVQCQVGMEETLCCYFFAEIRHSVGSELEKARMIKSPCCSSAEELPRRLDINKTGHPFISF